MFFKKKKEEPVLILLGPIYKDSIEIYYTEGSLRNSETFDILHYLLVGEFLKIVLDSTVYSSDLRTHADAIYIRLNTIDHFIIKSELVSSPE